MHVVLTGQVEMMEYALRLDLPKELSVEQEERTQRIGALRAYIKLQLLKVGVKPHSKEGQAIAMQMTSELMNEMGDEALPIPLKPIPLKDAQ